MNFKIIQSIFVTILLTIFVFTTGYEAGQGRGYELGKVVGVGIGLDTVKTILNKTINSNSTITDLTIVGSNKDTVYYLLSPKTIIK